MKIFFYLLILGAVGLEIIADVWFKQWAAEHRPLLLISGILLYGVGTALWAFSLKFHDLGKAGAIFMTLNLIGVVVLGSVVFGEQLTLQQKIGVLFGILCILLIEL